MDPGGQKSCLHALKGKGVIYFTPSVSVYPSVQQVFVSGISDTLQWTRCLGLRVGELSTPCFEPLLTSRHHIYEKGQERTQRVL